MCERVPAAYFIDYDSKKWNTSDVEYYYCEVNMNNPLAKYNGSQRMAQVINLSSESK